MLTFATSARVNVTGTNNDRLTRPFCGSQIRGFGASMKRRIGFRHHKDLTLRQEERRLNVVPRLRRRQQRVPHHRPTHPSCGQPLDLSGTHLIDGKGVKCKPVSQNL
ncbi:hypothetical protein ACIRYZ_14380 [Kitasatospora sp. NPDC101155]|uniref:hypothetical protein n=1 Tax=Kitasatospora sp. NPDC101155 TaxID=3364097 RepID=UPI0037FA3765